MLAREMENIEEKTSPSIMEPGRRETYRVDEVLRRLGRVRVGVGQVGDLRERALDVDQTLDDGFLVMGIVEIGQSGDDSVEVGCDGHAPAGGRATAEVLANGHGLCRVSRVSNYYAGEDKGIKKQ